MIVRYNSVLPVVLIVLGAIDLGLALWLLSLGGSVGATAIIGVVLVVAGLAQLNRVYFEYDQASTTIAVKGRMGQSRQFGGVDGGLLFVEGDRVFCTGADGRRKRVPVTRFLARGEQWSAVIEKIRQAPITGPAPMAP